MPYAHPYIFKCVLEIHMPPEWIPDLNVLLIIHGVNIVFIMRIDLLQFVHVVEYDGADTGDFILAQGMGLDSYFHDGSPVMDEMTAVDRVYSCRLLRRL